MEERIKTMMPLLDEKQRRIFLASEAKSYGYGGISKVSEISGVSIPTIRKGIKEIESGQARENGRRNLSRDIGKDKRNRRWEYIWESRKSAFVDNPEFT